MTERQKLISWRVFLAGCEAEFARALRDLTLMPRCPQETIRELSSSLRIVRDGPSPDEPLPALLRDRLHRHVGPFPSLEAMGLEKPVERRGLRATEARLAELERC